MNLQQIHEAREKCLKLMNDSISQFEKETGLCFSDLRYTKIGDVNKYPEYRRIRVAELVIKI